MRLRCPHCQQALDVVTEQSSEDLSCPSCGQHFEQAMLAEETIAFRARTGTQLGKFELLQFLGQGAFGGVWKARDTELDRIVAIKIPRAGEFDQRAFQRFYREARAASQATHSNIVTVHELGREADTIYIASEFIEGVSLKDRLTKKKFTPREAAELVAVLAGALHHAHQAGVVHRDLKPSNVLLDAADRPYLTDFGLARRESAEITMTADGEILGTFAYMSPEQARGESHTADRRSDVYSLGVILYELLAGQRPFSGGKSRLLLHQIQNDPPAAPRKFDRKIPRDLETICLRALEKAPDRRYATAQEMAADLRRYLRGEPIHARPVSLAERAWRWSKRNPALSTAVVLAIVCAALLPAALWRPAAAPPVERFDVRLTTIPPNAQLVFYPLDAETGEPLPLAAVRPSATTPLETKLSAGDYLVVAVSNEEGYSFHEVFRRVPGARTPKSIFRHLNWSRDSKGVIELPRIKIPVEGAEEGMAAFAGSPSFTIGDETSSQLPTHRRFVPAFLLDTTEITVGQMRAQVPNPLELQWYRQHGIQPRDEDALAFVEWDHAVSFAERIGKRLPDDWEYEFAATNGGVSRFPWGDDAERIADWEFGPAGQPDWDRLPTVPPVFGLFSNVAEWTASWPNVYPEVSENERISPSEAAAVRVVRGAPNTVLTSQPNPIELELPTSRVRSTFPTKTWSRGIGFRCARSQKPRLQPEDFSHSLNE